MRVVILGAGGVGGYLGARLIAAGADVTFLVREARAAQLISAGMDVRSPLGDFTSPVKAVTAAGQFEGAPDVVLLCCKETALAAALEDVKPLIGPETRLLPFLNGVRHLDILATRFPATPLLSGIAHGAVDLRPDGVIQHLSPFMTVIIGPVGSETNPIVSRLVDLLKASGVDASASRDIRQDMWNKFAFLAAFAGVTCLMRGNIGTILKTDQGRERILLLLDETGWVAQAEGFATPANLMDEYRTLLTKDGSPLTSSMLRDIEAGRRTEGAHILGDMLARARRHGIPTPLLALASAHVEAHERRLDATA